VDTCSYRRKNAIIAFFNDSVANPKFSQKCVLWCGSAAQELMNYSDSANLGLLQVGMHRVEKSENGPRRTLWYEVCTKYQVPKAIHFYGMKATPPVVSTIYPYIYHYYFRKIYYCKLYPG
jgi:hypothetical protein